MLIIKELLTSIMIDHDRFNKLNLPISFLICILSTNGFSQEIKNKFSVTPAYRFVFNTDYGKNFHSGGISIGYNVNNYIKPFMGIDYYAVDEDNVNYGKPRFNKLDLNLGLEGRFFKSKMFNLILQTKVGIDLYSNARKKPVQYLNIQDKLYEYDYYLPTTNLSDGIYKNSIFWSSNLLFSVYYKSFELKIGPGYQLGPIFSKRGSTENEDIWFQVIQGKYL